MLINDGWKMMHFDVGQADNLKIADPEYPDHGWIKVDVPGDVHSALIDKHLIEHPFFGHADQKCRWVEEKVWWYRTVFHYDKQEFAAQTERLELIFEGLDTYATIFLNGWEIGSAENMFIPHAFDVTQTMVHGRNVLAVKFDPVSERVKEKEKTHWGGFGKERIWTRKAQYHFGWDWGPEIRTVGIWKDVRLEKHRIARVSHVHARTVSIAGERALVSVEVKTETFVNACELEAEIMVQDDDVRYERRGEIKENELSTMLEIPHPKLWWTHDLGTPHLYQLKVRLFSGSEMIDEYRTEIGLREIRLQLNDSAGNPRFTFLLNGVEIFTRGANWIGIDSLVGSVPEARYRQLIQLAKEAHMNMLRVWGGGLYEKEIFYQECNRQGMLVWQDFMFACALYPDYNRNFMNTVREEVTCVVRRLRNHPCLALWCGNNENDWLYEVETAAGRIDSPFFGETIYHETIPEILKKEDPDRPYRPSSPFGGNDHNSQEEGDRHNWQVWHGNVEPRKFGENLGQDYSVKGVSFKQYKKDRTRFCSEFGIHASANRYTLEKYLPKGSVDLGSEELAYRNKDFHHEKGMLLMEDYTGRPKDLEEYINFSMLTQAEGLKYGVEHYRRNRPETSGALIWQLNDCWPGTSWSLIDYELLPKAAYYYAKTFFHPLLFTLDHDPGGDVRLWVVNDRPEDVEDVLVMEVWSFDGELVYQKEMPFQARRNAATFLATISEAEATGGHPAEEVAVRLRSLSGKGRKNFHYLRDFKDLRLPPARLQVRTDAEKREAVVKALRFARFVKIEHPHENIRLSDNFFDLLPGEKKTVHILHPEGKSVSLDGLRVSAANYAGSAAADD